MKTIHAPLRLQTRPGALLCASLLLLFMVAGARAQSTEIDYPTPIRTDEIAGVIAPRDLGDPRLTRYFYSFTGTPGDLIVTAESRNLEGDVDVFTAGTLRPLAKISLYAGATSSGGVKTIYLKRREALILRVEARTPNDMEGSFRVRFTGSFEPMGSDVPDPEPVTPTISSERSLGKKTRRVTATGARINEPEPEPEVTRPTEVTPSVETATETPKPEETPATAAENVNPEPEKPRPTRTRRPRTPRGARRSRSTTPTARRTPAPAEPPQAQPAPVEPASGPRLIIETRDGMRVERYMTTVRRVTVENGQLVVVGRDGKVERQPMSNVLRMAIEP